MAKHNNKPNGKGRHRPPKGVVPPQFEATVIKPGEVRNPTGKNGFSETTFDRLVKMLSESLTLKKEDGTTITITREHAALLMLLNKFAKGPQSATNDPDWRWAGQIIMDRICPIPHAPGGGDVDRAIVAEIGHEKITLAFVERVREHAGRNDPGPDDVLKFLDQQMDGVE